MREALTFLVASPHLRNNFFEKTVILLLEHDKNGSVGLVVNYPSAVPLEDLLEVPPTAGSAWVGGPVEPYIGWCMYRKGTGMRGEHVLSSDVFVSTSAEVLDVLQVRGQDFKLLMGYSGWGKAQLEAEAGSGAWLWLEADSSLIFETPFDEVWHRAYQLLGVDPDTLVMGGARA